MLVLLWLPTLFLSDMDSQILGLYIVNIPNFTILHGQRTPHTHTHSDTHIYRDIGHRQ
jgi:hypothetical protein